jgi:hypothetical protein
LPGNGRRWKGLTGSSAARAAVRSSGRRPGKVLKAVPSLLAGDQGIRMSEKMQEMRGMAASVFSPDADSRKNLEKLIKIVCQEL